MSSKEKTSLHPLIIVRENICTYKNCQCRFCLRKETKD